MVDSDNVDNSWRLK